MANQVDVNEKMRGILVDWLVEVHQMFKLLPDTLYLVTPFLLCCSFLLDGQHY